MAIPALSTSPELPAPPAAGSPAAHTNDGSTVGGLTRGSILLDRYA